MFISEWILYLEAGLCAAFGLASVVGVVVTEGLELYHAAPRYSEELVPVILIAFLFVLAWFIGFILIVLMMGTAVWASYSLLRKWIEKQGIILHWRWVLCGLIISALVALIVIVSQSQAPFGDWAVCSFDG